MTERVKPKRTLWQRIRRVWATAGSAFGIFFIAWSLLAYRATEEGVRALRSDGSVAVSYDGGVWRFQPSVADGVGLVFFPGALVDPAAYAPLLRVVAAAGHTALLVELPRRGAFGGADGEEPMARYLRAARTASESGGPHRWVMAGHSLGGVVASRVARNPRSGIAGLVLVGTSHPRDFSLAYLTIPVTKVYGTRDTIADWDKQDANRGNLPASTQWVRIDGGNHSQFGYYGFQPGDWPATISRDEQQRLTAVAVLDTMQRAQRKD